jgi:predicted transcriptional regulator
VLKTLDRLRAKNLVVRDQRDGIWHYSPTMQAQELQSALVETFVQNDLGGQLQPFVQYLQGQVRLTDAERAVLQQLVDRLETESGEPQ